LLYPNALDTRNVLGWLLGQIPKETTGDTFGVHNSKIEEEIDYLMSNTCVWTPEFCNAPSDRNQNFYKLSPAATRSLFTPSTPVYYPGGRRMNADQKSYFNDHLPFITAQAPKPMVPLSVLEYNTRHFTENQEYDAEWNSLGLSSGLNPNDYNRDKQKKILAKMAEHIRATTSGLNKGDKSESIDDLIKNLGNAKGEDSLIDRTTKFRKDQKDTTEKGETEEEINKRRLREKEEIEKKLSDIEAKILFIGQQTQVCSTEILQLTANLQKKLKKQRILRKNIWILKLLLIY